MAPTYFPRSSSVANNTLVLAILRNRLRTNIGYGDLAKLEEGQHDRKSGLILERHTWITPPPPIPCSPRAIHSQVKDLAAPQRAEPTKKMTIVEYRTGFRPTKS